ncbi:MAG: ferrous iron transport protein B, partial [Erysipelotrichaceae bacterium]|nr:ferrous iron transport protein B [Erysipelotrichaceae bacterium]
MGIRIALAGNPNSGKTTLFNALTGSNQFVGNWPGVTVEKKEGKLKGHDDVIITDLPGIYSLSPYTLEEVVARNYLITERPDAILNIVDGTNLERNLYLTTQLTELGIPVVIAINMMDLVTKKGDQINIAELERQLGCKIVNISALKGTNVQQAAEEAIKAAKGTKTVPMHTFSGPVEHALAHIEEITVHDLPDEQQRWYAVKLFERDEKVIGQLNLKPETLKHIEKDIQACEKEMDDDAESIITNERYVYIGNLLKGVYKKTGIGQLTTSDRIDKIVTNRILGLPIFGLIMFGVYWLAMGPFGTFLTDWTNDVFGGWLTDGAASIMESIGASEWLVSLVSDGIVGGVGAVLGFVPQMLVLFLMLCILEDVGYMARVAFVLDRIFRKFGLSGKSFIPMLIGSGCGVPGVMA